MESLFTEIRSDHIDENGVVHIDGWRSSDEDAEGEVIAICNIGRMEFYEEGMTVY